MPLNQFRWYTCMNHNTINNARYRTGDHGTRIVYAISHGITAANLNRNAVLLAKLHQLQAEWDDITVDICSCNVLQVAAHGNADFQALLDNA